MSLDKPNIDTYRPTNPTGKGGFGDHPEHSAKGRWKKENSIPYNQNAFLAMPVEKFKKWSDKLGKDKATMAQEIAYQAVLTARKDLGYLKEVTDRTSGKPNQNISVDVDIKIKAVIAQVVPIIQEFVPENKRNEVANRLGSING